jgi:hypothetical protein
MKEFKFFRKNEDYQPVVNFDYASLYDTIQVYQEINPNPDYSVLLERIFRERAEFRAASAAPHSTIPIHNPEIERNVDIDNLSLLERTVREYVALYSAPII